MKSVFILFLIFIPISSHSQAECSDVFDFTKSETVYLNQIFQVTDSSWARYKIKAGFVEYDSIQEYNRRFASYSYDLGYSVEVNSERGEPIWLNGTLMWTNSRFRVKECYADGKLKTFHYVELNDNFDTLRTIFIDYDSLYIGQTDSYFISYRVANQTEYGFFRCGETGWGYYREFDSRGRAYVDGEYPYVKGIIPPFIGIVGGLEGFQRGGYELGLAINVAHLYGDVCGGMSGLILTYKRRFDKSYYSLNAEIGVYAPFCAGIGYSFNSNGTFKTHSWKLTTGITLFHLQMLYSYNFYKNSKNEIPELFHHTFTLRYALPVLRIG
ncbi:MAG: hypothetical protein HYZ14_18970 [Bacteroidetes bacterium]|nr:hypothetical protein [Bacteroidota bacterium]